MAPSKTAVDHSAAHPKHSAHKHAVNLKAPITIKLTNLQKHLADTKPITIKLTNLQRHLADIALAEQNATFAQLLDFDSSQTPDDTTAMELMLGEDVVQSIEDHIPTEVEEQLAIKVEEPDITPLDQIAVNQGAKDNQVSKKVNGENRQKQRANGNRPGRVAPLATAAIVKPASHRRRLTRTLRRT